MTHHSSRFRVAAALAGACCAASGVALAPALPAQQQPTTPARATAPGSTAVQYPATRKGDQVDVYHGVRVADPYRWLEDTDSPETKAWVQAQNAVTDAYLAAIPERAAIKARLTRLWNYPKYTAPIERGGKYFYSENSGLQNQSVLYVSNTPAGPGRVLLDPNALSPDGTVALSTLSISDDGRLLGYGTSASGSDWQEFHVRDVASGRDLPDTIAWVKFSGMAWTKDGKGFFYSRYDEPKGGGNVLTDVNKNQKLYYHRLGQPQSADRLVYERPDHPDWGFGARVTDDGKYVVINVSQGTDQRNRLYFIDLDDPGSPKVDAPVVKLLDAFDASYGFVDNAGTTFYLLTDKDAPRGRVIALDVDAPRQAKWRTIVPEAPEALESAAVIGDRIVASYLEDAHASVRFFSLGGVPQGELALPGLGAVGGIDGRRGDREFFYTFTSFLSPTSVYRYDLKTGRASLVKAPQIDFDASRYETKQVFYTSKDGTRVPMFITARKGVTLDGNNPTLLYAYGGFNISLLPSFSPATLVWLEMGGVYAQANLRGGGEYGKAWHEAGTLQRKQNVFDDFIAGAEYLIREKYTQPSKLAIQGGSNGGLLIGAVMAQRPDLFGVALPAVGVMDMLRFHKFTIGWGWASDYGTSDDSAQFRALYAYSPLHNLRPGTRYPATLVTTADHDDRVVPGHSFKFAATLQAAQAPGGPPVLIRIESKAGHGGGKPTSKRIDEVTDLWAFTLHNMGVTGVLQ